MRMAGCKSYGNKPYLVDGFSCEVLRGFLVGKFPKLSWFGVSYSNFMQATVLGRQFTAVAIDDLFRRHGSFSELYSLRDFFLRSFGP